MDHDWRNPGYMSIHQGTKYHSKSNATVWNRSNPSADCDVCDDYIGFLFGYEHWEQLARNESFAREFCRDIQCRFKPMLGCWIIECTLPRFRGRLGCSGPSPALKGRLSLRRVKKTNSAVRPNRRVEHSGGQACENSRYGIGCQRF